MVPNISDSPEEFNPAKRWQYAAYLEPKRGLQSETDSSLPYSTCYCGLVRNFSGATICRIVITAGSPYYPYWDCVTVTNGCDIQQTKIFQYLSHFCT
jgi:hypothetical protein